MLTSNIQSQYKNKSYAASGHHDLQYYKYSDIVRYTYDQMTNNKQMFFGQQFEELDTWIYKKQQTQLPYIICSQPLEGKKTLLCSYIEHLKKGKHIVLYEFGSYYSTYSDILSSIMTNLRHELNINQKVELNNEKLRRYFKYWLQIASNISQNESIGYSNLQKKKIVIIIEGVDLVIDNKGMSIMPAFWLPQILPSNIKMIYSVRKNSAHYNYFKQKKYSIINYMLRTQNKERIFQNLNIKLSNVKNLPLLYAKIVDKLVQFNSELKIDGNQNNNFQVITKQYVEISQSQNLSKKDIQSIFLNLLYSKKGLQYNQILKSSKVTLKSINEFFLKFTPYITKYNSLYYIWHPRLKNIIRIIFDKNGRKKKNCHLAITKTLKKSFSSARQIEELIYHMCESENYIQLKQLICRIQNFLILYTPYLKNLLCSCWITLQSQLQYDPVYEYNKYVQGYLHHYYLKQQDLFKIVFQISLFFKQYSQFQNSKTPQFRHPMIKGQPQHLDEISIYGELNAMKMLQKQKDMNKNLSILEKKSKKQSHIHKQLNDSELKKSQFSVQQEAQPIKNIKIQKVQKRYIENLNIKMQSNQQKFKQFYISSMKQYLTQYVRIRKKIKQQNDDNSNRHDQIPEEQSDEEQEIIDFLNLGTFLMKNNYQSNANARFVVDFEKIKDALILKSYSEYKEETYHRKGEKQQYYYYKQWLWLQFPWIAQSLLNNYSQLIIRCITSPTEYISVKEEHLLIQEALKIAQIAKQNKLKIYSNQTSNLKEILYGKSAKDKLNRSLEASQILQSQKHSRSEINLAKWKLNLLNLSVELQQTSRQLKDKGNKKFKQSRNHSAFMTEVQPLKNDSSIILPKVPIMSKQLKTKFNAFMNKQNQQIQTFQNNEDKKLSKKSEIHSKTIKKYNLLKNQNQVLVSRIQQMKNSIIMYKNCNKLEQMNKLTNDITTLQQKTSHTKKLYSTQQALRSKLETIIKICDINKSHGYESEQLSKFITNIKYMIKIQQQKSTSLKNKLNILIDKHKEEIKKMRDNKKEIQKKLRTKIIRLKTLKHLTSIKSQDTQEIQPISKPSGLKRRGKLQSNISNRKNNTVVRQAIQSLQNQLLKINISYGTESDNNEIIEQFKNKIDKNFELIETSYNLKLEIQQKQNQINQLTQQFNNQLQKIQYEKVSKLRQKIVEKKQEIQRIKCRKELIIKSNIKLQQIQQTNNTAQV